MVVVNTMYRSNRTTGTGEGYKFESKIVGGVVPGILNAVDKGIEAAMLNGIYWLPTDVKAVLYDGSMTTGLQ